MPSTSEKQRKLACIALGIKKGRIPKTYSAQGAKMAKSMSREDLEEYCHSTK